MAWRGVAVVGGLVLAAASASAEEKPTKSEPVQEKVIVEADRVIVKKLTSVDFNDERVDGELTRPDGQVVRTNKAIRFRNLIQLRKDFNRELVKSGED